VLVTSRCVCVRACVCVCVCVCVCKALNHCDNTHKVFQREGAESAEGSHKALVSHLVPTGAAREAVTCIRYHPGAGADAANILSATCK
jgi:hypothetical protein